MRRTRVIELEAARVSISDEAPKLNRAMAYGRLNFTYIGEVENLSRGAKARRYMTESALRRGRKYFSMLALKISGARCFSSMSPFAIALLKVANALPDVSFRIEYPLDATGGREIHYFTGAVLYAGRSWVVLSIESVPVIDAP